MALWVVFAVFLFAAGASVAADGFVTSLTTGPADDVRRAWLVRDRERVHRALSAARLLCFLAVGASAPPLWDADGPALIAALALLLLSVGSAETFARTIGATRAAGPSDWLSGCAAIVTLIATPVVAVRVTVLPLLATLVISGPGVPMPVNTSCTSLPERPPR